MAERWRRAFTSLADAREALSKAMRNRDPHVPDNDDALLDRGIIRKSVHAFITSAIREPESNQATAEPFR